MSGSREWPTTEEQAEWTARLQAGDDAVWRLIHDGLARPISSIICSRDTRLSRDDLAAETMLELWAKRCLYSAERGSLRSFVYMLAYHAAMNMLRKVGDERPMTPATEACLACRIPSGELSDLMLRLLKAMDALSPKEQEIVLGSASADGTCYADDLARKYGTTPANVRVLAGRIRQRLRDALTPPDSKPPVMPSGEDSQS